MAVVVSVVIERGAMPNHRKLIMKVSWWMPCYNFIPTWDSLPHPPVNIVPPMLFLCLLAGPVPPTKAYL